MKVLLLSTYGVSLKLWEKLGLIDREISLYKQLLNKGVEFKLLTYGDNKDLEYNHLLNNISILPINKYINSRSSILSLFKSFLIPIKLKGVFKEIDIIKTNQVDGWWIALLAKFLYKKKIIIRAGYGWLRNYLSRAKIHRNMSYLKYIFNYIFIFLFEYLAYRLADEIISTNKSDIQFMIKKFKLKKKIRKKIHLIPNFIDTNIFNPLELEKKKNHILFIGRLSLEKNLFNLFEAFKDLKNYTLHIIGIGPLKEELIVKAKEFGIKVNLLGKYPNNLLPEIINQYNLFILPSFYEGNPKVLLEAMSCGIACIGTNVRGINNIIKHNENGYLSEIYPSSIRNAILTLENDAVIREKLGKNARKFIINNYSLELVVNKEYLLYEQILRK